MQTDFHTPEEARSYLMQMVRYIWRELTTAMAIYTFFYIAGVMAVRNAPAGDLFDLRPKGSAALIELGVRVLLVTGFFIFYTLPIFSVRRWIARLLRVFMFGLFVVFLTGVEAGERIAVVQAGSSFVFLKHWPFNSSTFAPPHLPAVEVSDTGAVHALSLTIKGNYGLNDVIGCLPVYNRDSATIATLDRLETALKNAGATVTHRTAS